jgi:pilus assembly protein FimV
LGNELEEETEKIEIEEEVTALSLDEASTKRLVGGKKEESLLKKAEEPAPVEKEFRRKKEPKQAPKQKEPAPRQQKARAPGRSLLLPILLILILLLLGGATAAYFFAPQFIPEVITDAVPFLKGAQRPDAKDPGVRRLSFKTITGSFVQSNKAGMLFLIKGMVANNYSNSRSFILIKGSILDDKGKVVKTKLAYAGNIFSENEIKEMTLDQINQALRNRSGKNDINLNVKPQAAVPFMVIFEELPENLSEFTVEAVSSAQGE